jgi:hypothetical protein
MRTLYQKRQDQLQAEKEKKMEKQQEGVRAPIVVYCLDKNCRLTSWHGMDHWEISMDRQDGITSGKYTSMMGPYCPDHRKEKNTNSAA